MHELTDLLRQDTRPAFGVTEPGAIAFAAAAARRRAPGPVRRIVVRLNSGMYKNAFTCGIPGSDALGPAYAAAMGAAGADPDKGLECLESVSPQQAQQADEMVKAGMVTVELCGITSRIFIEAAVTAGTDTVTAEIRDAHTNLVKITKNGAVVWEKASGAAEGAQAPEDAPCPIHRYTLAQLRDYALQVPIGELAFLRAAYPMNLRLLQAGLESPRSRFGPWLLAANGGELFSRDEQATASLLCNGAIEARVMGLPCPAMSITGSGAHGIIAAMPLYAAYKVSGYSEESLLRATALSFLVCRYIKEYSGKLSAFCGCAIAAGTGMACGLALLRGDDAETMARVIGNLAGSITGMICDGGNQGCAMKGVVAVDAAWRAVAMAEQGAYIDNIHGIIGATPEETMRNMGRIASPGMTGTEKTILEILQTKQGKAAKACSTPI